VAAAIALRKAGMPMREPAPHCVASRSFSAESVVASPGHEEVRVHVSFRMKKNMQPRFSTSDLFDAFGDSCQSCETQFKQYGRSTVFSGKIRTVKCIGDNVLLRRMLETESEGEVLNIDGSGYLGCALMGSTLAELGLKNGWAGAVIFGAIRDVNALLTLDFGIKALGSNPRKSEKNGAGHVDVFVSFGGATFAPGQWIYSDDDGVLVSTRQLT
jgi:regulator of ribonuclease activity A